MVKALKIQKEHGSKIKKFLSENDWLDHTTQMGKTQRYLLFPLKEGFPPKKVLIFGGSIESRNLPAVEKKSPKDLKAILKGTIPADKADLMRRSFDVVGDIAILDIPDELVKLEKSIAWTVLKALPNIEVVAKRAKKTEGVYRIRKITPLQGEMRSDTVYRESGLRMHIDLNKVFFSPRMGNDRIRISDLVKSGENILVMFAGIGPQALLIAKKHDVNVTAVELNPDAVEFMKENIRINYLGEKVTALKGDVKDVLPKLKEKFDRIVMVLPHEDEKYLPLALTVAKQGAVIHMYAIAKESEFKELAKRLEDGNKVRVKKIVKAGEYAPYVYRICVDMIA